MMSPSPENDSTVKAPDKSDNKTTCDNNEIAEDKTVKDNVSNSKNVSEEKEATLTRLDDRQLKELLDEAINYKSPKDRHGKSQLFQKMLEVAEEDDRKARAASASGSESVRYYNRAATRRNRHHRQPSSISENLTHGGSLNNLSKEELYESVGHLSCKPLKTVSTQQRQGGSLPCNVNTGYALYNYDKQYFDDELRKKESKKNEYTAIDMESESLLDHDSLNQDYNELEMTTKIPRVAVKFTSSARFEITPSGDGGQSNVDDPISIPIETVGDDQLNPTLTQYATATVYPTHYSLLNFQSSTWSKTSFGYKKIPEDNKRMDENGNALSQTQDPKKSKKKKVQAADKNVVVLEAKDVAGHRSDIINDLDKLMEYIGVEEQTGTKSKANVHSKSKCHKNQLSSAVSANGNGDEKSKKHKMRSTKSDKSENLIKSTSMEEISCRKLSNYDFEEEVEGSGSAKVSLRSTKSNSERTRERRSWGNSEQLSQLNLYPNVSAENLESAEFFLVAKRKKSKKFRSSASNGHRPNARAFISNTVYSNALSPEPRRKSACSVPHSEKSNDSSDEDSIKSLPIDTKCVVEAAVKGNLVVPVSYADIAKNANNDAEKPKWNNVKATADKKPIQKAELVNDSLLTNGLVSENTNAQTGAEPNFAISDVANSDTWPEINKNKVPCERNNNNNNIVNKIKPSKCPNGQNNIKNIKNNAISSSPENIGNINCFHLDMVPEIYNMGGVMPKNIPDVQTIEKMHLQQLQEQQQQHHHHHHAPDANNEPMEEEEEGEEPLDISDKLVLCQHKYAYNKFLHTNNENCDRTSARPAVVILSGNNNREVPGLTFGFEVNKQLLSDDVCDMFVARFHVPQNFYGSHNHDKIVNFIGTEWEDIVNNRNHSSAVRYYSENS